MISIERYSSISDMNKSAFTRKVYVPSWKSVSVMVPTTMINCRLSSAKKDHYSAHFGQYANIFKF